ncbi:oxidoreductase [Paraphaeosphaeria sporulosa]
MMTDSFRSNESNESAAQALKEKLEDDAQRLSDVAAEHFLQKLKASIKTEPRKATLYCEGFVHFQGSVNETYWEESLSTINPPVNIRFRPNGEGDTSNIEKQIISSEKLHSLLSAYCPASFSLREESVINRGFRKASRLTSSEFTTTFCPSEAGIIDVITQLLLPQTNQKKHKRSFRIKNPTIERHLPPLTAVMQAEFYSLKVYSTPWGKREIDTPRKLKRNRKPWTYDWRTFVSPQPCPVAPIRATQKVSQSSSLHDTRLSSRGLAQTQLFSLYTNMNTNFLPSSLKGADMLLYKAACALGLWCRAVPGLMVPRAFSEYYSWKRKTKRRVLFSSTRFGL